MDHATCLRSTGHGSGCRQVGGSGSWARARLTSDGYKRPQSQGALPEMSVRDLPSGEGPLMGENQPTACPWSCALLCTQL